MAKAKSSVRESAVQKQARAKKIVSLLRRYYSAAKCSLDHNNPYELLVATILSAQCTDVRVNKVTPQLFKVFPNVKSMAGGELSTIEDLVRSTGFYKNKAKNIKACCFEILKKYNGEIPKNIEDLSSLSGVGRKTANVVLGNAFGIPGMVVDTHVMRLSNRLGLVKNKNAEKIEKELEVLVPREHWVNFSHWLIHHGRDICVARTPRCEKCFLDSLCPKVPYEKG